MKEELITFETAKLVNEKGFTQWAKQRYNKDGELESSPCPPQRLKSNGEKVKVDEKQIFAHTQSLIQKWLRENHNIMIAIYNNASGYLWDISDTNGGTDRGWSNYSGTNESGVWDTYEEALENILFLSVQKITK